MVRLFIRGLFNNSIINSDYLASNDKWILSNKLERVLKEVILS